MVIEGCQVVLGSGGNDDGDLLLGLDQTINLGPSGVRALPLAAGINVGGHYKGHFGPSEVRASSGQHLGGHYFR
jgi:hypothetical protein